MLSDKILKGCWWEGDKEARSMWGGKGDKIFLKWKESNLKSFVLPTMKGYIVKLPRKNCSIKWLRRINQQKYHIMHYMIAVLIWCNGIIYWLV